MRIFAEKKFGMKGSVTLHIDDVVLRKAFRTAENKGVDLSALVEAFLARFVSSGMSKEDKIKSFPLSDEVMALAGSLKGGECLEDWKKEKEAWLLKKYGL